MTFARGANVGAVTDTVATTNSSGIAAIGSWTLGTTAGTNTLTATSGSLSGSPVAFTATGIPDAPSSLDFTTEPSASTEAGVAFSVQPAVSVFDQFGNLVTSSTLEVTLTLQSGTGVLSGDVSVNAVSGVATFSGLSINLAGVNKVLSASAVGPSNTTSATFAITPADASATTTTISVTDASRTADQTTTVTVQLIDQFGNALTSSNGENVELAASNGSSISGLTNLGDGTWSATFNAGTAGISTITGTLNAVAIADNAQVTVTAGAVSPSASLFSASTLTPIAGGTPSVLTATARDADGNPIQGLAVTFAIMDGPVTGALVNPVALTDVDGVATGSFISDTAGFRDIAATIDGTEINPTVSITVTPADVDPDVSSAVASDGASVAGEATVTITVTARDAFGNTISGASVSLAADGSGVTYSPSSGTTNASGVFTSTFSGTVAGPRFTTATVNSVNLTQEPGVTVSPAAASAESTVSGLGGPFTVGVSYDIDVQARDAFGNARDGTLDIVAFTTTLGSPSSLGPVQALGNGVYRVTYTPDNSGVENLAITINGIQLLGSPFSLTIDPPTQLALDQSRTRTLLAHLSGYSLLLVL